jgi:SHOCT-like domain
MVEKRIHLEPGQQLTLVEMDGDVSLAGWDEADVLCRLWGSDEQDLVVQASETGPALSARSGCELMVPAALPVKIRQAQGNLKVQELAHLDAEQVRGNLKLSQVGEVIIAEVYGNLTADEVDSLRLVGTIHGEARLREVNIADLQNVRGNLQAKEINRLRASRVSGNLQAKEIGGTLEADQVGGDAILKAVVGAVGIDQVAGNLVARHLTGGAKVPKVGGNLTLNGELGVGRTYQFQARGNATLRLPKEFAADLTLRARGKIQSSVVLTDEHREETMLTGRMGDGGTEIAVEAAGNILLSSGESEMAPDLGDEITRQVEAGLRAVDLEAIGRQVSEEMEAAMSRLQVKLEGVDWERIGVQTQQAMDRAMEQMRRNVDRMAEKAARQQERLERRLEREERRREERERRSAREAEPLHTVKMEGQDWADEEVHEPAAPEPDLDEERLVVLRMVEQGQITPAEAEMLLDALQ